MVKRNFLSVLLFVLFFMSSASYSAKLGMLLDVSGAISPAVQDYVQRSIKE